MTRHATKLALSVGVAAFLALAGCTADRNETGDQDNSVGVDNDQDSGPDPGGEPTGPDPNEIDPDRRIPGAPGDY